MTMRQMYSAVTNSPGTELSADITATDSEITVLSASGLPPAPNLLTIGSDETAETVRYTAIAGDVLTVERGFQGTAKAWSAGTKLARNFTAYDHDAFVENIEGHVSDLNVHVTVEKKAEWDGKETPSGAQTKADAAQAAAEQDATNKANQAETNTKNYVNGLVWQKHRLTNDNGTSINVSNGDANNLVYNGEFVGENIKNMPRVGAGEWYYINVYTMARGVWVRQVAMSMFYNTIIMRTGSDSGGGVISWGPWTEDLFTSVVNGKQLLATVIGGGLTSGHTFDEFRAHIQWCKDKLVHNLGVKGVAANSSEALDILADKVATIQVGVPKAFGTATTVVTGGPKPFTHTITVRGLSFKPKTVSVQCRGSNTVLYTRSDNSTGATTGRWDGYNMYQAGASHTVYDDGFSLVVYIYDSGVEDTPSAADWQAFG